MMKIKADNPVVHLAVFTVQSIFDFKGKYKAKHFSMDMKTSKLEE